MTLCLSLGGLCVGVPAIRLRPCQFDSGAQKSGDPAPGRSTSVIGVGLDPRLP